MEVPGTDVHGITGGGSGGKLTGAFNFEEATVGVNTSAINAYLEEIKTDVIDRAIQALNDQQETLFQAFRANWSGQSEVKFEENMKQATESVIKSLKEHYDVLQDKVYAINNAWVDQDQQMMG